MDIKYFYNKYYEWTFFTKQSNRPSTNW
jgi:hypothetical protein